MVKYSPAKTENFTNKKGSHKYVFMLVSTAEILAKKSVVHGSIYNPPIPCPRVFHSVQLLSYWES